MNDIITHLWSTYREFSEGLPLVIYGFLIRANLILGMPVLVAYCGFVNGWRHKSMQALYLISGTLIGFNLKLESFFKLLDWGPWILPFLLFGLVYLPAALSFLWTPHYGPQQMIRRRIYLALGVLFIINLFVQP